MEFGTQYDEKDVCRKGRCSFFFWKNKKGVFLNKQVQEQLKWLPFLVIFKDRSVIPFNSKHQGAPWIVFSWFYNFHTNWSLFYFVLLTSCKLENLTCTSKHLNQKQILLTTNSRSFCLPHLMFNTITIILNEITVQANVNLQ